MKTVEELIKELKKFPMDALCYAYEGVYKGEVVGIIINKDGKQGVIFCSESEDTKETEYI